MRSIDTGRWKIVIDETAVNGEGRVQIVHKPNQKIIAPSFEGARELLQILEAILWVNEYPDAPEIKVTEPNPQPEPAPAASTA